MTFVVDASVAIQWLVEEPMSRQASALQDLGEPLYAPDLFLAEMGNVVWKLARRGDISEAHARAIAKALHLGIPKILTSGPFLTAALDLTLALQHPVYDCLYLACAQQVKGRMVTVNARLLAAVKSTAAGPFVCHLCDVVTA